MALLAMAGILPQVSHAEGFTGADFARWPIDAQNSFIQTSVTMAAVIAAQTNEATAECLNAWYRPDTSLKGGRNDELRRIITDNPDYHPTGVILALLFKRCGSFR